MAYDTIKGRYFHRYCSKQPLKALCEVPIPEFVPEVKYLITDSATGLPMAGASGTAQVDGLGTMEFTTDDDGFFTTDVDCGGKRCFIKIDLNRTIISRNVS